MDTTPQIPQGLVEKILDNVISLSTSDPTYVPTLSATCLVARNWRLYVNPYRFSKIALTVNDYARVERVQLLTEILETDSQWERPEERVAHYIRSLELFVRPGGGQPLRLAQTNLKQWPDLSIIPKSLFPDNSNEDDCKPLYSLTISSKRLSSLSKSETRSVIYADLASFSGMHGMVKSLCSNPNLTKLSVHDIQLLPASFMLSIPHIKHLVLHHVSFLAPWDDMIPQSLFPSLESWNLLRVYNCFFHDQLKYGCDGHRLIQMYIAERCPSRLLDHPGRGLKVFQD